MKTLPSSQPGVGRAKLIFQNSMQQHAAIQHSWFYHSLLIQALVLQSGLIEKGKGRGKGAFWAMGRFLCNHHCTCTFGNWTHPPCKVSGQAFHRPVLIIYSQIKIDILCIFAFAVLAGFSMAASRIVWSGHCSTESQYTYLLGLCMSHDIDRSQIILNLLH